MKDNMHTHLLVYDESCSFCTSVKKAVEKKVTYKKKTYNDLSELINDAKMEGRQTKLVKDPFDTTELEKALINRKKDIVKIRMKGFELLQDKVEYLHSELKAKCCTNTEIL